jgi:hypothetical protein
VVDWCSRVGGTLLGLGCRAACSLDGGQASRSTWGGEALAEETLAHRGVERDTGSEKVGSLKDQGEQYRGQVRDPGISNTGLCFLFLLS